MDVRPSSVLRGLLVVTTGLFVIGCISCSDPERHASAETKERIIAIGDAFYRARLTGSDVARRVARDGKVGSLSSLLDDQSLIFMDGWNRPIRFHVQPDGYLVIFSYGSDGLRGGTPAADFRELDYRRDIGLRFGEHRGTEFLATSEAGIIPGDIP